MSNDELSAVDLIQLILKRLQPSIDDIDPKFEHDRLIERIGSAPSLDIAILHFKNSPPEVQSYKFVFSSETGTVPGFAVNKKFSKTAAVRSLFPTEKVFVIDTKTLAEMSEGESTFRIDYSISLDNQALSYLAPFFEEKGSKVPTDMAEVFVDPQPYMNENLHNLNSNEKIDKIRNKLRAYEILRTLDAEALKRNQVIQTTLSPKSLEASTHKLVALMFKKRRNKKAIEWMAFKYLIIYCQLLKMIAIQLKSPRRSNKNKIIEYLEFCHNDLKSLSYREISLAKKYFELGQNFKFFEKIQKKRSEIFHAINGMVWDLYHIRQLEEDLVLASKGKIRYFFSAILTFDQGLSELMDLYPLKSIAFCKELNKTVPFYNGNFINDISDNDPANIEEMGYFFEKEQITFRDKNRTMEKNFLQNIALSLQADLEAIAEVSRPSTLSNWYISKPK
jgi:hypothetical protein